MLSLLFWMDFKKEVLIESIESKTAEGFHVYNKIQFIPGENKDIWLMKQNHNKLKGQWDELKIEVDKTTKPYQASYFQFEKGVESEYRVACYRCHANGPRAIRPNYKSKLVENDFLDKLTILKWNLVIKHYGKISTPQDIHLNEKQRKTPLKYMGKFDNRKIFAKTCNLCHGKDSYMGRSDLVMQQKGTILHLIRNGDMPPWPFKLSEDDIRELEDQLL